MEKRLDEFIRVHSQELTDSITKEVLCTISGWREIAITKTLERIEKFLLIMADSIRQDNPDFLITYLNSISVRRIKEGVNISALHGLMDVGEVHIIQLIEDSLVDEQEIRVFSGVIRNALAGARVALSIAYLKKDQKKENQA